MSRLRLPSGYYLVAVVDDGFVSGPVHDKNAYLNVSRLAVDHGLAVMGYPGILRRLVPSGSSIARIVNLSGATTLGNVGTKVVLHSVEEAVRLGADAVSVHVSLGVPEERKMLRNAARIIENAHLYGLVAVVAAYTRSLDGTPVLNGAKQAHAARCAVELGANIVKVAWPGSQTAMEQVTTAADSAPVLIAGGEPSSDNETIAILTAALSAGAAGACVGRRLLASPRPGELVRRILENMGC